MNNNWKKRIIKFMTAQTISLLGSSLVQYAIIWYITLKTSSGSMMAIATVCGYLPQMLLSLFAGVWIDRYDRKILSILSDAAIAVSTLIVAVLFLVGYDDIWMLFVVLFIRSAGTGVQTPTVNALIPQLVPQEHLMKINGINSSINSLMMFLSPALSGLILNYAGLGMTFFVDVITAVIGIGIMFTIDIPPYAKDEDTGVSSVVADIKKGFSYLKDNSFILHQIIFLMIVMILISPSAFLTPLLVSRSFGAEVWRLTVSEMTFSLGAVAGGILIAWWGGFKIRIHTVILATVCYGLMMISLGLSPTFIIYLIFNFLIGITMPCFNAPLNVMIQEKVKPSMHGRIFSIIQIANACALPLGTAFFGPLADMVSVNSILIVTGILVILVAGINLRRYSALNNVNHRNI